MHMRLLFTIVNSLIQDAFKVGLNEVGPKAGNRKVFK